MSRGFFLQVFQGLLVLLYPPKLTKLHLQHAHARGLLSSAWYSTCNWSTVKLVLALLAGLAVEQDSSLSTMSSESFEASENTNISVHLCKLNLCHSSTASSTKTFGPTWNFIFPFYFHSCAVAKNVLFSLEFLPIKNHLCISQMESLTIN